MSYNKSRLSFIALSGALLVPASAFVACSPPANTDAGQDVASDTNVTPDVATDNGSTDAHPDVVTDVGVDVPTDLGADIGPDVFDGGVDAGEDVAPDVGIDTGVDAGGDDVVDAEVDADVDAGSDTGSADAGTMPAIPGLVSIAYGAGSVSSTTTTLQLQEPGNLVTNPGFETATTDGWMPGSWAATVGDPLINGVFGTYSATSSYTSSTISQRVDLLAAGYTAAQLDASPTFAVRQWYRGGGYNTADSYRLVVTLLDQFDAVLDTYDTGTITTNSNWTLASHTFAGYPTGVRAILFSTTGVDTEFWKGSYGSVIDQTSATSGAIEMRISNDGTTWSSWMPFAATMPWTLAGTGSQTVTVEFRDATTMASLGSATDSVTVTP